MPKGGKWFEDAVAEVARSLHPEATIRVRQKVEGPDGHRELDVEIRGVREGREYFILLECKDLKRPVDVESLDKLHALTLDLKPDLAIIYSNSGFSAQALRKANRLGIGAMSALRAGDKRIRYVVDRLVVAKRLSVDTYILNVFPDRAGNLHFPEQWAPSELLYEGLPVLNWASQISRAFIQEYECVHEIVCRFHFLTDTPFVLAGTAIKLTGFELKMLCSRTWRCQLVRADVTSGAFDHIRDSVVIPSGAAYNIGMFEKDKWEPCEIPPEEQQELGAGELVMQITLLNYIPLVVGKGTPEITKLLKPIADLVVDGSVIQRPLPIII